MYGLQESKKLESALNVNLLTGIKKRHYTKRSHIPQEIRISLSEIANSSAFLFRSFIEAHKDIKDECWLWNGAKTYRGYGQTKVLGKNFLTHRLSFSIFVGPIIDNKCVCHTCDVPNCCNPLHLFLGTNKDNQDDSTRKRRRAVGEKVGGAKLTVDQVIQIKKDKRVQRVIALEHGVTQSNISRIKLNKMWRCACDNEHWNL